MAPHFPASPGAEVGPGIQRVLVRFGKVFDKLDAIDTYFEATVQPVLHDGDELLVGQQTVTVLVKDRKDGVDQMGCEGATRTDAHSPGEFL